MNSVHSTVRSPKTTVFTRLGHAVVHRRRIVLVGYLVSMVLFGIFSVQVFGAMKSSGFNDPASQSSQVEKILRSEFGVSDPAAVLLISTPNDIDAEAASALTFLERIQNTSGVEDVISYWSTGGASTLRGSDGRTGQAIVTAQDNTDLEELGRTLVTNFSGMQGNLKVQVFGGETIGNAFNDTITEDLAKAESVAIPITALLLIYVFGSLVAAGLPFLIAGGTILGAFLTLFLLTQFTDVSVFALNLVTGLGLALGIDYSLLIINRFREELREGKAVPDAVAATVASAGRTVFVSGITVAVALSSLLVFPQYFLRSFAYAGIAVSLLAVLGALTAIPAILAMLGHKINRFSVRRGDLAPRDTGGWLRFAKFVMRNPWKVLVSTTVVLIFIGVQAFGAVFGQIDERALPENHPIAQAGETLRTLFSGNEGTPYHVILQNPDSPSSVEEYAKELSTIPGVTRVTTQSSIIVDGALVATNSTNQKWSTANSVRLQVVSNVRPIDPAGAQLVSEIRSMPAPAGSVLVGGLAAEWADSTSGVLDRAWIVGLWLAITTMVILFLFTGSILIPLKALVLNVLSLTATLGALVWVFQNGHLMWLTGNYTVTGTVDISTLALIAVIAFALSMDYEVFMLARINEEHRAGANTTDAVAFGLQRTGRIVTAAAALIAIVFASFLTSSATNIKQLGFGVTVAILLDATVVRALLVPAFMRIAGDANWWAPAPLRRLHNRFGMQEA